MDDTTKPDFAAADRDAPLMAASKSGAYYDDERNLARAYLARTTVTEADAMFATLAGQRVFVGGCRIVSDKAVPLDEVHVYDHLGNLTGRITGLTAALEAR